jgi:hypothetical protein
MSYASTCPITYFIQKMSKKCLSLQAGTPGTIACPIFFCGFYPPPPIILKRNTKFVKTTRVMKSFSCFFSVSTLTILGISNLEVFALE